MKIENTLLTLTKTRGRKFALKAYRKPSLKCPAHVDIYKESKKSQRTERH